MSDNTSKSWYALEITAEPEAAEALEFAFNELDALGTEKPSHVARTLLLETQLAAHPLLGGAEDLAVRDPSIGDAAPRRAP